MGILCVDQISDRVFEAIWEPLRRQVSYLIFFRSNFKVLKDRVEKLMDAREGVQHLVDSAEANAKGIEQGVRNWMNDVDMITKVLLNLPEDKGHARTGCSNGLLPYLWWRHQLSRKVFKMAQKANELTSQMPTSAHYEFPPTDAAEHTTSYGGFESRNETMSKILETLGDSNVKMIGVYGLGGVGKTTLVHQIARKAKDDKLFDLVVTAKVTQNLDIMSIQAQIADVLGLKFDVESEMGRASSLRQRLIMDKKNILVILDDLWKGINLDSLGIPTRDNQKKGDPSDKRCTILLTSRKKEVLSKQMDVKEDCIFSVDVLSDHEAAELFKKTAGLKDDSSDQLTLKAIDVAKKCQGLPIAIVALARALRNRSISEWNDASQLLEMHESVGVSIMLSYNHLESEELKSIFLLSAQMGQDPLIKDLVRYCLGLGVFHDIYSIGEVQDRINRSIMKLKDSCLFLGSYSSDRFTMHDIVRDFALSIAAKDYHVVTLRNKKLKGWPSEDELKLCTSISIFNSDIGNELPEGLDCARLNVFHVESKYPFLKIPDNFFEGMSELKVLVFTDVDLSSLPSSIIFLRKLRMLRLDQCVLGDISMIGELKILRVLTLSGSKIEVLPREIGKLRQLQLLDLRSCSGLKLIPSKVISSLTHLQELYVGNSFIQWGAEGQSNGTHNASVNELRDLPNLSSLEIHIPNASLFPKTLFLDKLERYRISVGDSWSCSSEYPTSRILKLQLNKCTGFRLENGIKMLFKTVEQLSLDKSNGVKNVIHHLTWKEFPDLKILEIQNNDEIQYVISSEERLDEHDSFPKLERPVLQNLVKFEKLCHGKFTVKSFNNLRLLKVKSCDGLRNLFSFSMIVYLSNLQEIEVTQCSSLEEIIGGESEQDINEEVEFTNLLSLKLKSLPALVAFRANVNTSSTSQLIENQTVTNMEISEITAEGQHASSFLFFSEQVAFPKLESLELDSIKYLSKIWKDHQPAPRYCFPNLTSLKVEWCDGLRYLLSFSMATVLVNLSSLTINECGMMEEIIKEDMTDRNVPLFPKLKRISIGYMSQLTTIWPKQPSLESFREVNMVEIEYCHRVHTIIPSHMVGKLQNLVSLYVWDCNGVEQIFDLRMADMQREHDDGGADTQLQEISLFYLPTLRHVWNYNYNDPQRLVKFKNLQSVKVWICERLRYVFPVSIATGMQKIETLVLENNHGMKDIVSMEEGLETSNYVAQFVFPQLTSLYCKDLPQLRSFYPGRHILVCSSLKILTVQNCDNVDMFKEETTNREGTIVASNPSIFSAEKVIPRLKDLVLGDKESKWILNSNFPLDLFCNIERLQFDGFEDDSFPCWFLHRVPNLENLVLYRGSFMELFPSESMTSRDDVQMGTVVQLKKLTLRGKTRLEKICEEGFELDPILQRLEYLEVCFCSSLRYNLVPPSASFIHLTILEVSRCDRLVYLVANSTANSLVQLVIMKIRYCKAIEQIIVEHEMRGESDEEIVFSQLKTLELIGLSNMASFCTGSFGFKFPLLQKLVVVECPKMERFSHGVISLPKLQKVYVGVVEEEEEEEEEEREAEKDKEVEGNEGIWIWEGNLNSTIQKLYSSTHPT
ncbi:Disease resistance protein [Quillaja saponaria]|uniref:Disease resistance protein n=1 Tax=Quillaja saponaria TaxID=32244 RepID=A0AAD7P5P2_QUISA|nr:Disease resistance protein [Quillaja saponaria]